MNRARYASTFWQLSPSAGRALRAYLQVLCWHIVFEYGFDISYNFVCRQGAPRRTCDFIWVLFLEYSCGDVSPETLYSWTIRKGLTGITGFQLLGT